MEVLPTDVSPASASGSPVVRRKGSKLGLFLARTEAANHPSIPCFFFTIGGAPVDLKAFRERVQGGLCTYERFRARLVGNVFVDDGSFNIEDHVRELTPSMLGGEPTKAGLLQFIERNFHRPMDAQRPMWEMLVLRGYVAHAGAPAQTGVIARVHHVIVDGTAAMTMLAAMSDEAKAGTLFGKETLQGIDAAVARARSRAASGCGPIGFGVGILRVLCKYAADACRPEPLTLFRGPTGGERSLAFEFVDAAQSLETARALGVTMNDLWMACVACKRRPAASERPSWRPADLPARILSRLRARTCGRQSPVRAR